jgi:hypothetical protein
MQQVHPRTQFGSGDVEAPIKTRFPDSEPVDHARRIALRGFDSAVCKGMRTGTDRDHPAV